MNIWIVPEANLPPGGGTPYAGIRLSPLLVGGRKVGAVANKNVRKKYAIQHIEEVQLHKKHKNKAVVFVKNGQEEQQKNRKEGTDLDEEGGRLETNFHLQRNTSPGGLKEDRGEGPGDAFGRREMENLAKNLVHSQISDKKA